MRKGLAAKLMIYDITLKDVFKYFNKNLRAIGKKNKPGSPYYKETKKVLDSIKGSLNPKL